MSDVVKSNKHICKTTSGEDIQQYANMENTSSDIFLNFSPLSSGPPQIIITLVDCLSLPAGCSGSCTVGSQLVRSPDTITRRLLSEIYHQMHSRAALYNRLCNSD
jgi:hypothetical protein